MSLHDVLQALQFQAAGCDAMGSAFSAAFLRAAQADVEGGGNVTDLFAPWEQTSVRKQIEDAVPLRFLGAFHDLALSGEAPGLAAHYPAAEWAGDGEAAWAAALAETEGRFETIADFMSHEPQTNEVGRSACLLLGFLEVARTTGLPLRTVELAASAGLNTIWDQFAYRLGDTAWGNAASAVMLTPEWRSAASPAWTAARVAERVACDRKPLDIADPLVRRRLQAYIWPDQPERLARLTAAIGLAQAAGVRVEKADAGDFVAARAAPQAGVATVVYHSVFWSYVPPDGQAAITAAIVAHGEAATEAAPFAWLRMEPANEAIPPMDIRLTMWPGGHEQLLARTHAHGAWIEYRP